METVILLTADEIKNNSPLGGNIDVNYLLPAIKTAQNTNIKHILGKELYVKLQEDYENDSLGCIYKELLNDYIKPMIIHLGASFYFTYGAYRIDNKGIYKANSDNATSINKDEVDYIAKSQEKLYKHYKKEFYRWIKDKDIPEYKENKVSKSTKRIGGWVLSSGSSKPTVQPSNSDETNECSISPEW